MSDDTRVRAARLGMREWPYGVTTEQAQWWMLNWAEQHGLRYSRRGRCLRWLTKGQCGSGCLHHGSGSGWYDHVTGWTREGAPKALVSQPYRSPEDVREQLVALEAKWGVRAEVAAGGWYGHGTSFIALWNDHAEPRAPQHRPSGDLTPWRDVEAVITRHGGRRVGPGKGRHRRYQFSTGPRGYFTVEVDLWHRWGAVAVDRIDTGDRPPEAAEWFKQSVWPAVDAAIKVSRGGGFKPGGRTYAGARPVRRADVPSLLDTWLKKEIEWGQGVAKDIGT